MSINRNNVSREVLSVIEKAMSKTERKLFKHNKAYAFVVITRFNELKRWGKQVSFTLTTASGALGRNSLVSSAWNDDENEAWEEARNALEYFVYGDKRDYKVNLLVIEKGDHPAWHWDIPVDRVAAEYILSEAFGTKAEIYGEDFVVTQNPTLRALRWTEGDTVVQYDLDNLKSRHRGNAEGCAYTEWE